MAHAVWRSVRGVSAAACALMVGGSAFRAHAQAAPAAPPAAARAASTVVTITGRSSGTAGIAGFGDVPSARAPLQAQVYSGQQWGDAGMSSIAGLARLDAGVSDAYNAEGYWSSLSVRGYALDNRFNYRRDGLPINAETAIALDNKERIELLKGTSGIQAGTSAPGGLVNLVVKRPSGTFGSASLQVRQPGALLAAVDLGDRFGADGRFGLRLNAAHERLDSQSRHTRGERTVWALAADWQAGADTLLQAEIEASRQRQPSVAGFSMLGDTVPAAGSIDLRRNLNDQPWRQPVVLDGDTASLRLQQRLSETWRFTAHGLQQRLTSDDRTAFPYGKFDPDTYACELENRCDRFAADRTFTYWRYISDNERRTTSALSLAVAGTLQTGGLSHAVEAGVLQTRYRAVFEDQVFDIAGTGNVDGTLTTSPSSPASRDANTNRSERSTEVHLRDAMRLGDHWQLWAGLRHSRLSRAGVRTRAADDGLRATQYEQRATIPWLAVVLEPAAQTIAYASWGQGLESAVAPNRTRYTNSGQALPALKSRQAEAGIKHDGELFDVTLAVFDIDRPYVADIGNCSEDQVDSCTLAVDGSQRHRGVEVSAALRWQAWSWQTSAMWLRAARRGAASSSSSVNGARPVNVPAVALRLAAEYRLPARPGLSLLANLAAEGNRVVLPDDQSARIPAWWRLDVGARWRQALGPTTFVWRLGLDNATGRRAWKESPYQFGHVYLYPLTPRTWRGSLQAAF